MSLSLKEKALITFLIILIVVDGLYADFLILTFDFLRRKIMGN